MLERLPLILQPPVSCGFMAVTALSSQPAPYAVPTTAAPTHNGRACRHNGFGRSFGQNLSGGCEGFLRGNIGSRIAIHRPPASPMVTKINVRGDSPGPASGRNGWKADTNS